MNNVNADFVVAERIENAGRIVNEVSASIGNTHHTAKAERRNLEFLAHELAPVIEEAMYYKDMFKCCLSVEKPDAFEIDSLTSVIFDTARHEYKFIRNADEGPLVVAHTRKMREMARIVANYIATRILEVQRPVSEISEQQLEVEVESAGSSLLSNVLWALIGVMATASGLLYFLSLKMPGFWTILGNGINAMF